MSFRFDGSTSARLSRTTGNVSSTGAMTTTMWVKRTAALTGLRHIFTYRSAGDSTGHDLVCNDPGQSAHKLNLQANFATAQAVGDDPLGLNVWLPIAVVGSGGNISFKYFDGVSVLTKTVGQTAFVPAALRIGDGGNGATAFTGLMSHVRAWNVAKTDPELLAEWASASVVSTTGLVSAHSGGGGTIALALAGQTGTAFSNAGGVTYDADAPTFDSYDGVVVSGDSTLPSEAVVAPGARVNRLLYSGTLSNAVWAKQTNELIAGASAAPLGWGTSQRVKIKVNTGGVYQLISGLPSGMSVAVMAVKKVDVDFVAMRHMLDGFGSGAQGVFNMSSGVWAVSGGFGGVTGAVFGVRSLGGGWWLIWIAMTAAGKRILEFYPVEGSSQQIPAVDKHVDVSAFQYEDGAPGDIKATFHKPTTSAVVTRSLATVAATLSSSTIGSTQTTTVTAQLQDDAAAPWDQAGPVTFASSDPSKATVPATSSASDLSGRASAIVTAVSNGTSNITATVNGITSSPKTLTVGTAIGQYVEILVQPDYQGTTGWYVGVYQKHPTQRFPTAFLFEKSGQTFDQSLKDGQSRMPVSVPGGVTVTDGQVVEVAIENDSLAGKPQDGPGIFPATVIGAAALPSVPVNTALPLLSGTAQVTKTLSVSNGSWTNTPLSYTRQFQVSADGVTGWSNISGSTGASQVVGSGQLGKYIRGGVAGVNAAGSGVMVYSAASAVVVADTPEAVKLLDAGSFATTTITAQSGNGNQDLYLGGGDFGIPYGSPGAGTGLWSTQSYYKYWILPITGNGNPNPASTYCAATIKTVKGRAGSDVKALSFAIKADSPNTSVEQIRLTDYQDPGLAGVGGRTEPVWYQRMWVKFDTNILTRAARVGPSDFYQIVWEPKCEPDFRMRIQLQYDGTKLYWVSHSDILSNADRIHNGSNSSVPVVLAAQNSALGWHKIEAYVDRARGIWRTAVDGSDIINLNFGVGTDLYGSSGNILNFPMFLQCYSTPSIPFSGDGPIEVLCSDLEIWDKPPSDAWTA